nr:hypothetical protein CFP56_69041 [Quercus suber]
MMRLTNVNPCLCLGEVRSQMLLTIHSKRQTCPDGFVHQRDSRQPYEGVRNPALVYCTKAIAPKQLATPVFRAARQRPRRVGTGGINTFLFTPCERVDLTSSFLVAQDFQRTVVKQPLTEMTQPPRRARERENVDFDVTQQGSFPRSRRYGPRTHQPRPEVPKSMHRQGSQTTHRALQLGGSVADAAREWDFEESAMSPGASEVDSPISTSAAMSRSVTQTRYL